MRASIDLRRVIACRSAKSRGSLCTELEHLAQELEPTHGNHFHPSPEDLYASHSAGCSREGKEGEQEGRELRCIERDGTCCEAREVRFEGGREEEGREGGCTCCEARCEGSEAGSREAREEGCEEGRKESSEGCARCSCTRGREAREEEGCEEGR